MVEQMMSPHTLAGLLDMEVDTLYKWHSLGQGPRAIKIGERLIRYPLSEVERWMQIQNPQKAAIDLQEVVRRRKQELGQR